MVYIIDMCTPAEDEKLLSVEDAFVLRKSRDDGGEHGVGLQSLEEKEREAGQEECLQCDCRQLARELNSSVTYSATIN